MSVWASFVTACMCAGVLSFTCVVIIWAVKNILEWVDDINDSLDTIRYTHSKRKKEREAKK